jgi:hypothetical protein
LQPQRQWPTATAMVMGDGNGDGNRLCNSNRDGNGNCNGNGDCNGDGHGKCNNDKGRVASSCVGNVQNCGRGNTLPPPSWTHRSVHSPALHHGGDAANSVCFLSRGRVPDSSHGLFILFFTSTVQFTEQPFVCLLHYSGAQEPCRPIDAPPSSTSISYFCKGKLGRGLDCVLATCSAVAWVIPL